MTGSDTSTNALFGKLQAVTAEKLGIDPVIAMSANTCGGVCRQDDLAAVDLGGHRLDRHGRS